MKKEINKPTFGSYLQSLWGVASNHAFVHKVKKDTAQNVEKAKEEASKLGSRISAAVEAFKAEPVLVKEVKKTK